MVQHVLFAIGLLALAAAAPAAKTGGDYFTAEHVAAIRERAKQPEYAKTLEQTIAKAELIAGRSDEEIWEMIPDADLPRALNVNFGVGCPVHGAAVFKKGGQYPWIMSPDQPFKVKCPVGGEVYPSNDFAAYLKSGRKEKLDTTAKYVDDGGGWVDADGKRYWFVAHYTFWEHWRRTIIDGVSACYRAWLATGDERYAHKTGVALARISQVYPHMKYAEQAYHNGRYPAGINGRILDYIWENSTVTTFGLAYDAIFATLASDESLKSFAASRGVGDVAAAIEKNILQVAVQDIFDKKIWGNKFELGSLSTLALCINNTDPSRGATTAQMVDWILTGPGDLEFTLYNGMDRDGIGGESSPSYSSIWNNRMVQAADNLARLGVDIVNGRRWLRIARGPSEMRVLDTLCPRIGDHGGGILGSPRLMSPSLFEFGVQHFQDPYSAKMLLKMNRTPDLFARAVPSRDELRKLAKRDRFPDAPFTRDMGGYGLSILELDDGGHKHSATMYYGCPGASHGHLDRLTMAYHRDSRDVLTELGYPSHWGPMANWWVKNTPSHYCVMIDGKAQPERTTGYLTAFADLDGLKFAEAEAAAMWKGAAKDYRRSLALLDTGEKSALLIDAFVVEGGSMHDYIFHGLPYGEFSPDLRRVRSQTTGTLAGEDVEFGGDPGEGRAASGYQYFKSPTWYQPRDVTHFAWCGDNGLDMDAWFPRLAFDEVIVADTQPPITGAYPNSMPYILLRRNGQDLSSLFLGIVETGDMPSRVAKVTRLTASHPKAGGAVVRLTSGAEWRILVNLSGEDVTFEDGARSSARFAALLTSGGKLRKAHLIGVGRVEQPGLQTLTCEPAPEWTVSSVDYRAGTARVARPDGRVRVPKNGLVAVARNRGHSASYTLRSARTLDNGEVEISFGDTPLLTGRFHASWDAASGKIVSKERTGGVYNHFAAKRFPGMTAVSGNLVHTATITEHDGAANTFSIDPARGPLFGEGNDGGRSYVYIADIAPGVSLSPTAARTITPRAVF